MNRPEGTPRNVHDTVPSPLQDEDRDKENVRKFHPAMRWGRTVNNVISARQAADDLQNTANTNNAILINDGQSEDM